MSQTTATAQIWRHFPRYMMLAMALVFAVNLRFIFIAVQTFPGAATNDDFDTSNRYDAVLTAVAAQNALGWSETAQAEGALPTIDLTGADHHALSGAVITAQAERPLGPDMQTSLSFREITPGHYVAATTLQQVGQWDLKLNVAQGGHSVRVTRRIIVK